MLKEEKMTNLAHDIMKEQNFMHRLDIALHWYLPKAEANEVLEDYQDIRRQANQDGETIFQAEQDPRKLSRELQNPREYRRWLLMFWLLLLCPLVPFQYMLREGIHLLNYWDTPIKLCIFLFGLGLALALFISHRWNHQPGEPGRSHKPFAAAALLLLLDIVGALGAIYIYCHICLGNELNISGEYIINYLTFWAVINGLICLAALVMCRLRSCRWLGVYLIGLTMLLGIIYYMELFTNLYLDGTAINIGLHQLRGYFLPLACGLAASLKTIW